MRILRVQFNGRKQFWTIVEKSFFGSGGWKKPKDICAASTSKQEVEYWLDQMIQQHPDQYKRED